MSPVHRRCHITVMPLIVLNEEMTISDHGEDKLGHPTVKRFFFMAKFVACVQSQAIHDSQGKANARNSKTLIGCVDTHQH